MNHIDGSSRQSVSVSLASLLDHLDGDLDGLGQEDDEQHKHQQDQGHQDGWMRREKVVNSQKDCATDNTHNQYLSRNKCIKQHYRATTRTSNTLLILSMYIGTYTKTSVHTCCQPSLLDVGIGGD